MHSIRSKLIIWVWVLLSTIILTITAWNIYYTRQQLIHFFDTQLIQTNLTLMSLHQQLLPTTLDIREPLLDTLVNQHPALNQGFPHDLPNFFLTYQLTQVFQIWDHHAQTLIYKSKLAPFTPLLESNQEWRVFTAQPPTGQLLYIVAEPANMRQIVIQRISLAQLLPMLGLWLCLLLLSWCIIRWCIKPIEEISRAVAVRRPDYLAPISNVSVPREIKPLVQQINYLFSRLTAAIAREKRFTADAAHELRTPLAALKVQAQVAQTIDDQQIKDTILPKIIQGVDRCTHLIQQLTILAQIKPDEPLNDMVLIDLTALVREVIVDLSAYAQQKSIIIEVERVPSKLYIYGNHLALVIMIRNIIDNAIRYSKQNTQIKIATVATATHIALSVQDQGPGIPVALHTRVFEQFYRGEKKAEPGSGLGLAIVEQIAKLHQAKIELSTTQNLAHGLCFTVLFPIPTPAPQYRT